MTKSLALFLVVVMANTIPSFFVYGEAERPLEIRFLHVETVMARAKMHLGQVEAHKHDSMAQITFWTGGKGSYFIEDQRLDFSGNAVSFVPSGVVHGFSVDPLISDAIVLSLADSALPSIASQTLLALDRPVTLAGHGPAMHWDRLGRMMRLSAEEYFDGMAGMDRIISSLTAAALTQNRPAVLRRADAHAIATAAACIRASPPDRPPLCRKLARRALRRGAQHNT
ncbi:MAG: hypothetical protein AAAC47_24220, partial [Pararhizobium sp.]